MTMPFYYSIPFLCVFVIMVGAILLSVINNPRLSWHISFWSAVVTALASAAFLLLIVRDDTAFSYTMGKFPAPFGNEIRGGPFQGLMGLFFSLVTALSMLGGRKDFFQDVDNKKVGLACVMLNMVLASLLVLTYTNDAFTAYVFIEISTIAACALVMIKDSGRTMLATIRYLFMSLMGSGLFLLSLILLYGVTGHLLMPQLATAIQALTASGNYRLALVTCAALMTAGIGIKSAMFPFHRWLPDAHGTATTTASAVLSGLVLKGYAVLLVLFYVRVFSLDTIRSFHVHNLVFVLGFIGMIAGSVQAMREDHIKRMLAYSSVAQLGYVFMGIGLGTTAGIAAACFQILSHAVTKPLLFMSAGRLSSVRHHSKKFQDLRGSAWQSPPAGICYTIGALSMIGIPLLGGFAAKMNFAIASVSESVNTGITLFVLALSSILNALYYIPSVIALWSTHGGKRPVREDKDHSYNAAAVISVLAIFILGIYYEPVMNIIVRGLELL